MRFQFDYVTCLNCNFFEFSPVRGIASGFSSSFFSLLNWLPQARGEGRPEASQVIGVLKVSALVLGDGGHGVAVDVGAGGGPQAVLADVEHGAAVRQALGPNSIEIVCPEFWLENQLEMRHV